jgi:hypothetical protein
VLQGTNPVEEVSTLVTREPTGCAKRMRRSGLLYTLRSCHMWMEPSLAPPIMRRPVRKGEGMDGEDERGEL